MARTSPDCRRMPEHLTLSHDSTPQPSPTVRDVLMVLFRHRRLVEVVLSDRFLFGNRICDGDPQVRGVHASAGSTQPLRSAHDAPASSQADFSRAAVSEEEVNSEVELLRDDEVLRRVAEKTVLSGQDCWPPFMFSRKTYTRKLSALPANLPPRSLWNRYEKRL